jgi:hypothetical protein
MKRRVQDSSKDDKIANDQWMMYACEEYGLPDQSRQVERMFLSE